MHLDCTPIEQIENFGCETIMFGKIKKLYFVGIGGAGMSGIAEILHNLGYTIKGSDNSPSSVTEYLHNLGITIYNEQIADNVSDADVVVISSAISKDNPEVKKANELGIPVIKRAEMLGELMRLKFSIGVAGTHGKTSTTSMIGRIVQLADLKPTIIVGGIVAELGTGASLGSGDYLIAEADEYDKSFLAMYPSIAVITNLEADHLDCYDGLEDLKNSFLSFMNRVPFYGSVILSADDENLMKLRPHLNRPSSTFGFTVESDYRAVNVKSANGQSVFSVYHNEDLLGEAVLNVPGRYNVSNALAAIATCHQIEIPFEVIADALRQFKGVGRRFERVAEINDILLFDDYAHHPTEVKATLEMAKNEYKRRIIVVFQPHLFSRTKEFAEKFAEVLAIADKCILTDIYPAREKPIEGVTSELILKYANEMKIGDFEYVGKKRNAPDKVLEIAQSGDLIITMGAGSITHIKNEISEGLHIID
ncbi:MAG: UDP-N-acetylmuramate--L-alanine ligase [Candidatus Zixiibacteriota bacterium]|nr:MAG: UDP-N-acetylmuramate--L-alanine ligase [candidate division Zixibacteria bacterium]